MKMIWGDPLYNVRYSLDFAVSLVHRLIITSATSSAMPSKSWKAPTGVQGLHVWPFAETKFRRQSEES